MRLLNKRPSLPLVAALALILGTGLFLTQSLSAGWELEEWVKTPAANQRTLNGDCPQSGEDCWELCLRMNQQIIPQGEFACMSAPEGGGDGPY